MTIDIEKLDKNLVPNGNTKRDDAVFRSVREAPFKIYGLDHPEEPGMFRRMPQAYSDRVGPGCTIMSGMTVGGRVRFCTDSPYLIMRAYTPSITPYTTGGTLTAMKGFDVYIKDEEGRERYWNSVRPPVSFEKGYESIVGLPGKLSDITLYFPHYNQLTDVELGLAQSAILTPGSEYSIQKPVVFFGSSITQGCCASRAGNVYSNYVGRLLDADTINLGYSGGAHGQQPIAEYIGTLDASAFVCDYDFNAKSAELLKNTHEPFFQTIRRARPELPILFLTKPVRKDPELSIRRNIIFDTVARAWAAGDHNVYFLDGLTFFDGDDWDMCTCDGTHPNDLGFKYMGEKIAAELRRILSRKP
ncbi:MAG: hypothetical protein E7463_02295 [Ruminococcaceae bacterium]|nr:hypothetical protein [Oscillospiraceae bacterium]